MENLMAAAVIEAWFLLTMADVLAWGFGQVVAKKATVALGPASVVLMMSLIDGATFGTWWAFFHASRLPSASAVAFSLAAAYSGLLGYILYFEALQHGGVAAIGLITGASPLITVVGAVILLQETFPPSEALGVALLIACIFLLSYEPLNRQDRLQTRATVLALATLVLWGAWGLFTKVAIEEFGGGGGIAGGGSDIFIFYTISNATLGIPYFLLRRRRGERRAHLDGRLALFALNTFVLALGILALTLAFAYGKAALVSALSGTYPVVTLAVVALLLKEKIHWFQLVAASLFVVGVVLVAH